VWTGTVNYGDGTGTLPLSINQATKTFTLNHVYAAANTYTVTVTVNDGDGGSDTRTRTVTVVAPPRVGATVVNGGAVQRSRVTDLTVTFSTQVAFAGPPANAFTLRRNSDSAAVTFTATANTVGGVTVVTLGGFGGAATNFGSLA